MTAFKRYYILPGGKMIVRREMSETPELEWKVMKSFRVNEVGMIVSDRKQGRL